MVVVPADAQPPEPVTVSPAAPSTRRVPESVLDVTSEGVISRELLPEPVRLMISMPLNTVLLVADRPTVIPEPSTWSVSVPVPPWMES